MTKTKPTLVQLQQAFEAVSLLREYFQPFDVAMHDGLYGAPGACPALGINGAFINGVTISHQLTITGVPKKDTATFIALYQTVGFVNSLFHTALGNLHSRLFDVANYGAVKGNTPLIPETGYNIAIAPVGDVKIKLSDPDEFKLFI